MDWCANMFGLGDDFHLEKKKGGGVIMVCFCDDIFIPILNIRILHKWMKVDTEYRAQRLNPP